MDANIGKDMFLAAKLDRKGRIFRVKMVSLVNISRCSNFLDPEKSNKSANQYAVQAVKSKMNMHMSPTAIAMTSWI